MHLLLEQLVISVSEEGPSGWADALSCFSCDYCSNTTMSATTALMSPAWCCRPVRSVCQSSCVSHCFVCYPAVQQDSLSC